MYYQNPTHLLSDDYLDSIPIASENNNVIRNRSFESIFCHLASQGVAFNILRQDKELSRRILSARQVIASQRKAIVALLVHDDSMNINKEQAEITLRRVDEIFEFLLMDLSDGKEPLIEGSPNSIIGAVWKPSRFNPTIFANNLLKLLKSIQEDIPVILTELGVTKEVISQDVVDILVNLDRIAKPKGKLEKGHHLPFLDAQSNISDELLMEVFQLSQKNPNVVGTLQSLSKLQARLNELHEEKNLRNIDSSVWNKVLMLKYWHDWMSTRRKDEKIHTFSQLVNIFHFALSGDGLSLPPSLYASSGTTDVELVVPLDEGGYKLEKVSHDEAIRHYLPGHLSYRESGKPMKTRLYMTAEHNDFNADIRIDLARLTAESLRDHGDKGGHELPLMPDREGSIPIRAEDLPWGVMESFNLEKSEKIELREVRKIILGKSRDEQSLNAEMVLLADDDESPRQEEVGEVEDDNNRFRINLPQSFGTSWNKVTSTTDEPKIVFPFSDNGKWKDEDGDIVEFVMDGSVRALFDSITFHKRAKIAEYSVGLVRKYTGVPGEVQFWYVNNNRGFPVPSAMGREIDAPALRLELNKTHMKSEIESTRSGIMNGSLWIEAIDFVKTALSEELGIGPFTADHVLRMVINRVPNGSGVMAYFEAIEELTPEEVHAYEARWANLVSDTNQGPGGLEKFIDNKINHDWSDEDFISGLLTKWTVRCLAHGMGISLLQSGRAFTGCRDEDLGFHIDVKDLSNPILWIYDRTPEGNGASELIHRFFHIPKVLEHLRNHHMTTGTDELTKLPTRDYFRWLLNFLQPCFNHQSKSVAIAAGNKGVLSPETHILKLSDHIQFLLDSYNDGWAKEPINYDIYSMRKTSLMRHFDCSGGSRTERRIDNERLRRITESCWTSCPQCLEEMGISPLGPLTGPLYSNKRLLDRFVKRSLGASMTLSQSELDFTTLQATSSNYGTIDIDTPAIDLRESGFISPNTEGDRIMRPMTEVDHVHEFVDTDDPITEDGKVRMILRTIVTDSKWRKS